MAITPQSQHVAKSPSPQSISIKLITSKEMKFAMGMATWAEASAKNPLSSVPFTPAAKSEQYANGGRAKKNAEKAPHRVNC
jgi:hypothetical protein